MSYQPSKWPQIIAHRGDSGLAPENTWPAIERAIEIGVDMVEVDVRMTKDGVPVLLHFERLEHTTTGSGLLADHTWEEIQRLDAGAWKDPEFAGERVLSLEDVLNLTRGRVPLNLDFQAVDAVAPGVAVVRDAGLSGDVVVSGCQVECFELMGAAANEITTLLNLDHLPARIDPAEARAVAHRTVSKASALGAAGINLRHTLVDAALVARAREAGLGVWVFVVDDEERFGELVDMGVTAVTTNWPARMLALKGNRTSRGSES
ncbi:MAG: glycerophosphodiester phosphodiesterase family protein [Actinobacteria bacterium]|nr:glycerophosphodiester phosphodiesterase family protein [Actinomycetota bacterium]